MFVNYFKFSLRLLTRHPYFTAINIFGLGIGITTFYCLWTYSISELRANQFYKDYNRIARIGTHWIYRDDQLQWNKIDFGFSKSALPGLIQNDISEMESSVRILMPEAFDDFMVPHRRKLSLSVASATPDRIFLEERLIYADSNLFEFFSIPLIAGADHGLKKEGTLALSESAARRHFGSENPLGQTMVLNDSAMLTVACVFKDLPHNTHLEFDIVISNKPYLQEWQTAHFGIVQNFVKLKSGVSFAEFQSKINQHRQRYWHPFLADTTRNNSTMYLQPLQDIPFEAREGDGYFQRSKTILTALGLISIAILLMAWANYINMSIAQTFKRIKEFQTRKINGALTSDLMAQSVTESLLINVLALLAAVTLLQLIQLPLYNIFYISIPRPFDLDVETVVIFVMVFIFGILMTGVYPVTACGLNKQPISPTKPHRQGKINNIFPSALPVFQFSSSIVLILWAYIIFKELNFILNKDYGIDKNDVVLVETPIKKSSTYLTELLKLKSKLSSLPGVNKVALSKFALGDYLAGGKGLRALNSTNTIGLDPNGVTEDYLDFYSLRLIAGHNLIKDDAIDKIIISRHAARRFGFKTVEAAVGSVLQTTDDYLKNNENFRPVRIVGVIEDFRTTDFLQAHASRGDIDNEHSSRGSVLTYLNSVYSEFLPERIELRISSTDFNSVLQNVREEYAHVFGSSPFNWQFLNDHVNKTYKHETFQRNQIILYSLVAMAIASLGLLGNIAQEINYRMREVAIRKILGADTFQIMLVLIKSTAFQLGMSAIIGIPLALLLGQQYMRRFSENAEFHWWEYSLPLIILTVIMFSSIVSILFRTARKSPIETLKQE